MYEKNYLLILGLIVLIAFAGFAMVQKQSITGLVAPGTPVQKPMLTGAPAEYWKEVELIDHVHEFFGTDKFIFPQDTCGQIAESFYSNLEHIKTTGLEEFSAGGEERFKVMIFKDYNELGKITLIKGFETPETIKIHSTIRKMVMTIDGWKEIMELEMELQGYSSEDRIVFNSGKIKALDFECKF
ncbi:hypothetical protein JW851_05080 [Candidatus Woesearchaeota archaeon]|nr:hypothetical protein [Candidatus Woesearchaeota archaeon]